MSVWQLCNVCSIDADNEGWEFLYQYDPGQWDCMTCGRGAVRAWHETENDGIIEMGLVR